MDRFLSTQIRASLRFRGERRLKPFTLERLGTGYERPVVLLVQAQCVAAQHVESWTASILLLQQALAEAGHAETGRQLTRRNQSCINFRCPHRREYAYQAPESWEIECQIVASMHVATDWNALGYWVQWTWKIRLFEGDLECNRKRLCA